MITTKSTLLPWSLALLILLLSHGTDFAQARHLNIAQVKESINPGAEEFIKYAISRSAEEKAECLILLLDTPGGLMSSMRGIVQSILNSEVPVVVYVAPAGAQAASAGVFVTTAADVAAMAPGTNIGAAHPVTSSGEDIPSAMNEKVLNDMLAFARSIAGERGRNAQWLEESITKSVSATAEEAYKLNVIDMVSDDLPSLVKKLNGWEIHRKGQTIVLHTDGIEERTIEPGWRHGVLGVIGDPNVAYILLMIGLAGLYFELSQPGAVLPGVVGGIALILSLFAMQTLPVNYAGFLLIFLAILFFLLEIKITSYGLLSLAGVISLILGSLMLFWAPGHIDPIAMSVFIPTVLTVSAFFIGVATIAYRAQKNKPQTGVEALVGLIGEVKQDLAPEGKVFVSGELWNAVADRFIAAGQKVEVISVDNLKLKVKGIDVR